MPIPTNPVSMKKLLLVKRLYQSALTQSRSRQNDVGRLLAIVEFDLAIETMLKTIMAIDPKEKGSKDFLGVLQSAESVLSKQGIVSAMPDRAQIVYVHDLRNDAQHKAKYPSDTEVNDCRTYTRDFLRNICLQVWGLDFDTISMLGIIQHEKIKELLSKAEEKLAVGEHFEALAYAKEGLKWTLGLVSPAFVGEIPDNVNAFVVAERSEQKPSQGLFQSFEKMRELAVLYSLGINHAEFIQYEVIAGCVLTGNMGGGKISFAVVGSSQTKAEDIEFAVQYAINTVAQIEGYVGSLDSPFGVNYWV
ncbi:MAG TPA: hypothetical protein VFD58_32320 [Blastocatellia bacterium]|nr:hypothetical protein [Blastocatellia bacterium]